MGNLYLLKCWLNWYIRIQIVEIDGGITIKRIIWTAITARIIGVFSVSVKICDSVIFFSPLYAPPQ